VYNKAIEPPLIVRRNSVGNTQCMSVNFFCLLILTDAAAGNSLTTTRGYATKRYDVRYVMFALVRNFAVRTSPISLQLSFFLDSVLFLFTFCLRDIY